MDIHSRVAAVLHIVLSSITLCATLLFVLVIGGVAALDVRSHIPDFLLKMGVLMLVLPILLSVAYIVVGVAFLKGSSTARVFLIVFSVLDIFAFPYGTVLGIYTLWALLRKQPIPDAGPVRNLMG